MRIGRTVIGSLAAVALALAIGQTAGSRAEAAEDESKWIPTLKLKYGFRRDPMKWANEDGSFQAALVRAQALKSPKPGDKEILEAKIKEAVAKQKEEGKPNPMRLVDLGCSPARAEVRQALDAMCREQLKAKGHLEGGALTAACRLGWKHGEEPARSARRCVEQESKMSLPIGLLGGCPWVPISCVQKLSACDLIVDADQALGSVMTALYWQLNAVGCWDKLDPWQFLDCAYLVDHPVSHKMVAKLIPVVLFSQGADGGWGDRSLTIFRTLAKFGLLDSLRKLPPLPRAWRVVRSIPAPEGDLSTMAWGSARLWVLDKGKAEAVAVSPKDGRVLQRLKLPEEKPNGIGWYSGRLAVTAGHFLDRESRARVLLVDPETGEITKKKWTSVSWKPHGAVQVGDELWVSQGHWTSVENLVTMMGRGQSLSGGGPVDLASDGSGIWHLDWMVPGALFKSDLKGNLAEYLDDPLFTGMGGSSEEDQGATGIAHDGKSLWLLHGAGKRVCMVEKTAFGHEVTRQIAALRKTTAKLEPIIASLSFPGPTELPPDGRALTLETTVHNPLPAPLEIRYVWEKLESHWSMQPAEGAVKIAPGGQSVIRTTATLDRSRPRPLPVRRSTILIDGTTVRMVALSPVPPILRRLASAARVTKPPKIDGNVAEAEYGAAKRNRLFQLYRGYGPATHNTSFRLAYDDQALYLGITVQEPNPDGVAGEPRERDGEIWRDDDTELFIDATCDRATYHQFALGLKHNTQFDCIGGPDHGKFGDTKWDGEWRSAVRMGKDAVIVELAIPYQTLGVAPPKPGDKWGLNFCRNRLGKGKKDGQTEKTAWCLTYRHFHVPSHFGTVTFE